MKTSSAFPETEVEQEEARAELDAVLRSALRPNSNMAQLLRYVCEKHFQGRDDELKEYSIAVEVFDRTTSFDSSRDSIVRVEAHRLRSRLSRYYGEEGRGHSLRILIPPGSYVPLFVRSSEYREKAQQKPQDSTGAHPTQDWVVPSQPVASPDLSASPESALPIFVGARRLILLLALLPVAAIIAVFLMVREKAHRVPANSSVPHEAPLLSTVDGSVLQMICGLSSPNFVDSRGEIWVGDRYYTGGVNGAIAPKPIAFTESPDLYYRRRRALTDDFSYNIPLAPGSYELRLYFADAFFGENNLDGGGEGSRIFDVTANGSYLLKNFDIVSDAGGSNAADVKVFKDIHPFKDGMLHLQFHSKKDKAFINAIQILKTPPDTVGPRRFIMAAHSYRDAKGALWDGDGFYRGGVRLDGSNIATSTPDAELWRNERFGNFVYSIPVASEANYAVTMRFRENAPPGTLPDAGSADVFNVYVNGRLLLENFKVEAQRNSGPGQIRTFSHLQPNAQGKLIFSFVPVHNYALVNSIEVVEEKSAE